MLWFHSTFEEYANVLDVILHSDQTQLLPTEDGNTRRDSVRD